MDPFKEAMGRAMAPEPSEREESGGTPAGKGEDSEMHSMHHFSAGGKHHVTKHSKGGVEHSEHEAGSEEETCPMCGGSGEVEK